MYASTSLHTHTHLHMHIHIHQPLHVHMYVHTCIHHSYTWMNYNDLTVISLEFCKHGESYPNGHTYVILRAATCNSQYFSERNMLCTASHCITLLITYEALPYTNTLPCVVLPYITTCCHTLPFIALHYITLPVSCLALHACMHAIHREREREGETDADISMGRWVRV